MALMAQPKSAFKKNTREEGILLHNGNKYAVGLTWLMADDDIDAKLAKDRASKMGADFFAMRTTAVPQHGFGYLALGHRPGMISAASVAADMLVGEWHGVFTADNGWWYLAVHADAIAPDGDIFFFSEEQAFQHFQERAASYKWPRNYAPENWNLPDANSNITLDKLLENTDMAATLKPSSLDAVFGGTKQKSMAFLFGGLFIAFLLVAFLAPTLFSAERPDLNEIVRSRVLAPGRIFAPPPVKTAANSLETVDLSAVRGAQPSALINVCANSFARLAVPLPGWDLGGLTCNANNQESPVAAGVWQKKSGSLETAKTHLSSFPENVTINFNGTNQITAQTGAGNLRGIIRPMELVSREQVIQQLYERFGLLGKLDILDVRPPPPPVRRGVEGFAEQEVAPPPPPHLTMKLATQTPANVLASYFDVPGLKVQNVQWNRRTGSWTYDAEIQFDSKALREFYAYQQRLQQRQ